MADIHTISPTTGEVIASRHSATKNALNTLAETATQTFETFRKTTLSERKDYVKKALDILEQRKDELAAGITTEMGRPIAYTPSEITTAVKRGHYLLKISDEALSDTPGEPEEKFKRYIKKVPVGPVLILFPWNYPYLTLVNSLIPAILAGNTVILKPSPQTPGVAEHIHSVFEAAGLPSGVLQFFHAGSPETVEVLVRDPRIQHICFTGSVPAGLSVQKVAADRIVTVGLELGGKDPAYVRSDVDVKWAAEEIVDGALFNSGQSCCSIERVYVHDSIYDEFVKAVQDVVKGYRVGDPSDKETQIGPVISKAAKARIEAQIKDAVANGAKDVTPANPTYANADKFPGGSFVVPTVLVDVTQDMAVMQEETFGPVIPIMKVSSDEEAVKLMNDSEFGLTASIWSKNEQEAFEVADQVEAGTVFVNRCDFPSPDLAWTGWKNSGKGQTLSKFGFDQFVKLKSYHLKDYPK